MTLKRKRKTGGGNWINKTESVSSLDSSEAALNKSEIIMPSDTPAWISFERSIKTDSDFAKEWSRWERQGTCLNSTLSSIVPFKSPLGRLWDNLLPEECTFSMRMFIKYQLSKNVNVGMIFALRMSGESAISFSFDSSNFMVSSEDREFLNSSGIALVEFELKTLSSKETDTTTVPIPSMQDVQLFSQMVSRFSEMNPGRSIGVFCPSGYNLTGFMIASYLVSVENYSVDAALQLFASSRPPGIYYLPYIQTLYQRYEDASEEESSLIVRGMNVSTPEWSQVHSNTNIPPGIDYYPQLPQLVQISELEEKHVKSILLSLVSGKVSASLQHSDLKQSVFSFMKQNNYRITWRTQPKGTKLLFLILKTGCFFINNDIVHSISGLRCYKRKNPTEHLDLTLMECELVSDNDHSGQNTCRLLISDMMCFSGKKLYDIPLKTRLQIAQVEIVDVSKERIFKCIPMRVRVKPVFKISEMQYLFEKVCPSLPHFHEGVLFLPESFDNPSFQWVPSDSSITQSELLDAFRSEK